MSKLAALALHLCGGDGLVVGACASASVPQRSSLAMASAGLITAHTRQPQDVSASISTCRTCWGCDGVCVVLAVRVGYVQARRDNDMLPYAGCLARPANKHTQQGRSTVSWAANQPDRTRSRATQKDRGLCRSSPWHGSTHHLTRLHQEDLLAAQQRQRRVGITAASQRRRHRR